MVNWMKNAIEDLRLYEQRAAFIDSMEDRLLALDLDKTRIKSALKGAIPVQGGTSTAEDSLINNIDECQRLQENLNIVCVKKAAVDKALAILTEEQRLILDRFFVHRMHNHVNRLCEELNLEQAQIYRKKDQALKDFTIALYGIVDL